LLSLVLAIVCIGWAFHSGKGRRWAYIAYLPVFLVTFLSFRQALGMLLAFGALGPIPIVFTGLFLAVLRLGIYGYATRHRRPSIIGVEGDDGAGT
jgi:hypothetical protein